MPYQKMIGILLEKRNELGKDVQSVIHVLLVTAAAGVAGLDWCLSAPRCSCFTDLVERGLLARSPGRCFTERFACSLLCLVLATRSPGQVLPDTASVVRSSIGATLPDDFLGNGSRGGLCPQGRRARNEPPPFVASNVPGRVRCGFVPNPRNPPGALTISYGMGTGVRGAGIASGMFCRQRVRRGFEGGG